jgi:hypothetical protein
MIGRNRCGVDAGAHRFIPKRGRFDHEIVRREVPAVLAGQSPIPSSEMPAEMDTGDDLRGQLLTPSSRAAGPRRAGLEHLRCAAPKESASPQFLVLSRGLTVIY